MKRPKRSRKVWRVPEALALFIHGREKSNEREDRVRWLTGELQRLFDIKDDRSVTEELRSAIYSAWPERLQAHIPLRDTTFFDDLAEAQRRLHIREIKDAKTCLAEAYIILARPAGTYYGWLGSFVPDRFQEVERFLQRHRNQINTETVRKFAERLWKHSRSSQGGGPNAPLELVLDIDRQIPETRWTDLFHELGLTKEFLPRSRGGRPLSEAKTKKVSRAQKAPDPLPGLKKTSAENP